MSTSASAEFKLLYYLFLHRQWSVSVLNIFVEMFRYNVGCFINRLREGPVYLSPTTDVPHSRFEESIVCSVVLDFGPFDLERSYIQGSKRTPSALGQVPFSPRHSPLG